MVRKGKWISDIDIQMPIKGEKERLFASTIYEYVYEWVRNLKRIWGSTNIQSVQSNFSPIGIIQKQEIDPIFLI